MSWEPAGILGVEQIDVLSPWSDGAIGSHLWRYNAGATASAAYPSANLAFYVPVTLVRPFVAMRAFAISGATSGNNVDVGIYQADTLAMVVSSGAFARVASGIAYSDITDTLLLPGGYYLAFAHNSTNNIHRNAAAAGLLAAAGVCTQASAYTLPATATLTITAQAYLPAFGLTGITVGP